MNPTDENETNGLCTEAERERMHRSTTFIEPNRVLVEHPTRLHAAFVASNEANHNNKLISAAILAHDPEWTRVVYQFPRPRPAGGTVSNGLPNIPE